MSIIFTVQAAIGLSDRVKENGGATSTRVDPMYWPWLIEHYHFLIYSCIVQIRSYK